eukprot:gene10232-2388_t
MEERVEQVLTEDEYKQETSELEHVQDMVIKTKVGEEKIYWTTQGRKGVRIDACTPDRKPGMSQHERIVSTMSASPNKRAKTLRETEELRNLKKDRDRLKEKIRKLELVRTYRSKHDTADLDELIPKWRQVCQQAMEDLSSTLPEVSVKQLIAHYNIPMDLVHFDPEDEEFLN